MLVEQKATAAVEQIHSELGRLKKSRLGALAVYLSLVSLGFLLMNQGAELGPPREGRWLLTLFGLAVCACLGASVLVGVPLVRQPTFRGLTVVSLAGLIAALALSVDWDAKSAPPLGAGLGCFSFGTGISVATMVLLGVVSGRIWRRFPNPGLILAISTTAIGTAVLHIRCGAVHPIHVFGFHLAPLATSYLVARGILNVRQKASQFF